MSAELSAVWWSPSEGVLCSEAAQTYVWEDDLPADAVRLVPLVILPENFLTEHDADRFAAKMADIAEIDQLRSEPDLVASVMRICEELNIDSQDDGWADEIIRRAQRSAYSQGWHDATEQARKAMARRAVPDTGRAPDVVTLTRYDGGTE